MNFEYICNLSGTNFSPEKAEQILKIHLNNKTRKGELHHRGRYKNQPYPFGSGQLEIPYSNHKKLIDILQNYWEKLKEIGMEDIFITLDACYENQCNLEIPLELMKILLERKIVLGISCYQA